MPTSVPRIPFVKLCTIPDGFVAKRPTVATDVGCHILLDIPDPSPKRPSSSLVDKPGQQLVANCDRKCVRITKKKKLNL